MTVREGRDVIIECVVLDAMGVVFRAADDVAELLVPFVRNRGGVDDVGAIEAAYLDASRGSITADAFWLKVGLSPSLEDDYLSGHALTPGAREFLGHASDMNAPVWLLSNGYDAPAILFVDDREKNVAAAAALGIHALQFGVNTGFASLTPHLRGFR